MTAQRLAAALAATCMVTAAAAASEPLAGDRLNDLVSGKRIFLSTPFGGEFPLFYKPNGAVTGDGTKLGLGRFFAPTETGRWWVDGKRLCQKWPTWYKGQTSCFTITPTGPGRIGWTRDDGTSGKARIEG
ncbi:hypothetical protein [Aquibium sp. ELW1220]|jgi:hypothetical protein|uniref:hypothetical protein n=1 Tax=Aquibium sp. ELW1220 TaxID=2976766 RepID=UPI0025B1A13D|nr:hypothetical protein [Aquibium sp. ELW1220]MDN2579546.1 hypothetical protein [Aquibium sp. ELW1220]